MATPLEQAKLLECILHELQLKDFNFGPKACRATQATQAPVEAAAGPAGHRSAQDHLLTPEPETWSETPSPSAASGAETWWTQSSQSTSASVESSPLLKPKQLCLDADKIQLPLAELLPTPNTLVMWRVMNPNAKFKASCGFPLVSHQLSNHLLEDFRVIFAAGNTWASQNKGKKQQASSKVDEFFACASRVASAGFCFQRFPTTFLCVTGTLCHQHDEAVGDLQLYFHLGAYKLGPFRTFPERSVSELCELPVDWRRLVEKADMSLTIGVEVVA